MNSLIEGNRCHNATCINYHKTIPGCLQASYVFYRIYRNFMTIYREIDLLRNGWLYAEESNDDVTVYLRTKIIIDIAALFS
ncbi:hypothetical protein DTO164E3_524 [Paecilomyces variotii]|nr:hypothetical protein DTO164E3_524 [Paecilomyces variotii]